MRFGDNRTEARDYPRHLSFHWGDPYRIRRLEKQLAARDYHSRDSAAALQNDDVSEMARAVLPLIASDLWWTGPVAPEDPIAARRQQALEMLGDWNGEMSEHAPEPLIFAEWMRRLTPRLIEDELGPDARRFDGPQPVFVERVFRNLDGAGVWCDIDKTSAQETCAQIAQLALDDALGALSERYGSAPRGWRLPPVFAATGRCHTYISRGPPPIWRIRPGVARPSQKPSPTHRHAAPPGSPPSMAPAPTSCKV